jgi:C-terminal processing protease CtpA/Prc
MASEEKTGGGDGGSEKEEDKDKPKFDPANVPDDVKKILNGSASGWKGIEMALRKQMVEEGHLPKSALWDTWAHDDGDASTTIELETDEEFLRTFTEPQLGLALNNGPRGSIIVKRAVPGSPAASRRIPPGVMLIEVNEQKLEHLSLKEAQTLLKDAERPVKLKFKQTDTSRDLAQGSHKVANDEREADARAKAEAARLFAEEMRPATPTTELTFSCTYNAARLGLVLQEGEPRADGKKSTLVKMCVPRTPSYKSGIPAGAAIVAINGKSLEFRRFKEVKKLIELAQRPITLDFSTEDEPTFPRTGKARVPGMDEGSAPLPAYAFRPV